MSGSLAVVRGDCRENLVDKRVIKMTKMVAAFNNERAVIVQRAATVLEVDLTQDHACFVSWTDDPVRGDHQPKTDLHPGLRKADLASVRRQGDWMLVLEVHPEAPADARSADRHHWHH
jgi:endo-alpha-1,4-polygalactosaminidase (GH114 family)